MTDDELDDLLTPRESEPLDREAIFAQTVPHLPAVPTRKPEFRWRVPVACTVVGVALGWFAKPVPPPERVVETIVEKVVERVPVEVPAPSEPVVQLTPERLELEAEKATDRVVSAKLYLQAGDAFLRADRVESAVRCYRLHLNELGDDRVEVLPADSWLLSSLKQARR